MSFMNQFLDSLKAVFNINPQKAVVIAMNEDRQIITIGSGELQTPDAIVMLSSALANVYLEMSPEAQASFSVESLNTNVAAVINNRIKQVTEARMQHLQNQMNQVQEPVHIPSAEPMPVPVVVEEDHSTVQPAVPVKRTRKKAKDQIK